VGSRERGARVSHEELEERELARREDEAARSAADLARQRVENDVADADGCGAGVRATAPEEGADARHELVGVERLREIVVGAGLEAADAIGDGGASAEHEGGRVDAHTAKLANDLESVTPRQSDVQDDEVGPMLERARESSFAVARGTHAKAVFGEQLTQKLDQIAVVLDDEDGSDRHGGGLHPR